MIKCSNTQKELNSTSVGNFLQIEIDLPAAYGLDTTFVSWFKINLIHVWMLLVRLRSSDRGVQFSQDFFDAFWRDCEHKLVTIGVRRSKKCTERSLTGHKSDDPGEGTKTACGPVLRDLPVLR